MASDSFQLVQVRMSYPVSEVFVPSTLQNPFLSVSCAFLSYYYFFFRLDSVKIQLTINEFVKQRRL